MTTSRLKCGASLPELSRCGSALMESAATGSRWARWMAFLIVALVGLAIRLSQLDIRPMHTDEAVNAYIVGQLLAEEPFIYDPQDRHGPALAALALPTVRMQGAKSFSDLTESELRVVPVVAGTITILLFGAAVEMFGFIPSLLAAILFAVAPLPVYYDRYFVHEALFCAATFGLILSGWRASQTHSVRQAALAGACAALMLACKETALLHLFALGAAAVVFKFTNKRVTGQTRWIQLKSLLAAVISLLLLSVVLFTWFGRNWKALPALLHAAPNLYCARGGSGSRETVLVLRLASHWRLVWWNVFRLCLCRTFHCFEKTRCFTLSVARVLRVVHRRYLQSDSIQNTMVRTESVAAADDVRRERG